MGERPNLPRRAAAEAIGTFALVFAGCGAIVTEAEHPGTLGTVGIALVFGLVIMAMVYAAGHLSGAHLNPAVTVAFVITRHFPRAEALAYLAAQVAGALAGAAAAIAIGGTVGLDALFGGPLAGATLGALACQLVRAEHAGPPIPESA